MSVDTVSDPVLEAARRLLHRGDDGGPPIHRNGEGFSGAWPPKATALAFCEACRRPRRRAPSRR